MHDVLEGSLAFEIKELLKHLIAQRVITLASLNEVIRLFPYVGSDALNKPSMVGDTTLSSSDHHIRQNGMFIIHAHVHVSLQALVCTHTHICTYIFSITNVVPF